MADRYRCRIENAVVRPERSEALADLVRKLFERRHHNRIAGPEKDWLTVELVQSLRELSQVYRKTLSTETEGPLPFALGYFRIRDGRLELVSDEIPANVDPEPFVRFLSEFLQPGARLWFFHEEEGAETWEIRGVGEVTALPTDSSARGAQDDDGSSGTSS